MNVVVTSITADQTHEKGLSRKELSVHTAEIRGRRNKGRKNVLLLYDLHGPEYNFVDKPHEKQVPYEGHTHQVIRLGKHI